MELRNSTLDDLSAVIGFSATLRLVAWFGKRAPMYVPAVAKEGQLICTLIGITAAKALSKEWGNERITVPGLNSHQLDVIRHSICQMAQKGMSVSEMCQQIDLSERRVQQIYAELEAANLLEKRVRKPLAKNGGKNIGENRGRNAPQKGPTDSAPKQLPVAFFSFSRSEPDERLRSLIAKSMQAREATKSIE